MTEINDIKTYLKKIDLNNDGKIDKAELKKAENSPSLWLNKIKNLVQENELSTDKIIKGLSVEPNPKNKPVTEFHDKRPGFIEEDYFFIPEKVWTKEEYKKNITDKGYYVLNLPQGQSLNPDLDFSNSEWLLQGSSFTKKTFANTPKEHLPEGYDPEKIIEFGKNPGLNTRAVHKAGITGKGVKVALMDWQLPPSENYDSNIVSYHAQANAKNIPETMHGAAVTSILAGKETGVAPDAEVYYFAEYEGLLENSPKDDMINSLKQVLELNKNLPENEKIRVISISGPVYGGEEAKELAKQLNDSGVWVMSSNEFWKNFGYLEKNDPMGNPDDFDNYKIHNKAEDEGLKLYVNSGNRTVAHYSQSSDYRHDSKASASWAIPVVAGYYALACQADPSMTKERFLELAEQTAQVRELDVPQNETPQEKYESSTGFNSYMLETIRKYNPQITEEEYNKMDEEELMNTYFEKMKEDLDVKADEDLGILFIQKGKEVLSAKGSYDENGVIKDIPEKFFPKQEETVTQAKIIDIEALIERIKSEKDEQ